MIEVILNNNQQELFKCTKCGELKPRFYFSKKTRRKNGVNPHCKECDNLRANKYYQLNKHELNEKLRQRRSIEGNRQKARWMTLRWMCKRNNIPLERCFIPRPENCNVCGSSEKICYDHDHLTGKFRGWLCQKCNVALGMIKDNVETLKSLIAYLEKQEPTMGKTQGETNGKRN